MSARKRAPSFGAAPDTKHQAVDGLGPERVADIQRARLLAAMVEVVAERGAGNVSVAHVVARSGVSRRTFYELFGCREDCFLAAFDEALARASQRIEAAYDPRDRWAVRIRASLIALLGFIEDEPSMGRLLIVESLAAGPEALERRSRVLNQLIAIVDEGRTVSGTPRKHTAGGSSKSGVDLPLLTAEGVVGAVLSVLYARISEGSAGALVACPRMGELVNPLMSMIVLPYLGSAASRRELARPVPERSERTSAGGRSWNGDPLRELGMRLTYRTVRALSAVAAGPGSSNRQVGDAAGIADQGQVSKLLARLQRLGLIESTSVASARGAPNAWVLTAKGAAVEQTLHNGTGA